MNIKKYIGCISNIFTIVDDDLNKNIILNYKKVSNYQQMNSIDNFIIRELKKETNIVKRNLYLN